MINSNTPADGGPAFPCSERAVGFQGMTLRDYFATAALPVAMEIVKQKLNAAHEAFGGCVAQRAYMIADEMLVARTVPPQKPS